MYIGVGTLVVVLIVVAIIYLVRRSWVKGDPAAARF
jgi:hypothetical protein